MKIQQSSIRRGFNLVEVVVSSLLVGTLLIAALQAVGISVSTQSIMADESKAAWLADALLMEIHEQSYMEPGTSASAIGQDVGETNTSRVLYDDVDDYHNWNETQIQNKDGTIIPDLVNWRRSVSVSWVTSTLVTSGTETGVKRINVSVTYLGRTLATRSIIRAKGL